VTSAIRRDYRVPFGLFLFALAIRFATFLLHPAAAYPDADYYVSVAREIASGHGAVIPYLWAFPDVGSVVPAVGSLPLPSNAHWMPLASFVQLPFIALLGPTDLASALPFILTGAFLAPFTWALGMDLFGNRRVAALGGLFAACPVVITGLLSQPDNYTLYALLVVGALWGAARAVRDGPSICRAIGIGIAAGLSMWSRNDGFLVPAAIGLVWLVEMLAARRATRPSRLVLRDLLVAAAVTLAVIAPWYVRQLIVFGSLSPSAASGHILWIRTYTEMFAADGPYGPDHLLGEGLGPLIASRIGGAVMAVSLLLTVVAGVILAIPAAAGALAQRHSVTLAPFGAHFVLFLGWSAIVAAPHLATGNFIHAAVALVPLGALLAAAGIDIIIGWLRRHWPLGEMHTGDSTWRLIIIGAVLLMAAAASLTRAQAWDEAAQQRAAAFAWLDAHTAPDVRVMSADPGSIWLGAGRSGIATPTSDLSIIERAVSAYGVRYLVLESDGIVESLVPVLRGTARPAWLGAPVFVSAEVTPSGTPKVAIYPVVGP
jgi:4-amino-4-deoxy-L-arabinose transferase-like glycosyltransferase